MIHVEITGKITIKCDSCSRTNEISILARGNQGDKVMFTYSLPNGWAAGDGKGIFGTPPVFDAIYYDARSGAFRYNGFPYGTMCDACVNIKDILE